MEEIKVDKKNAFIGSQGKGRCKDYVAGTTKELGLNDCEAPNEITQKVLQESKKGKNVKLFNTKEDFFEDLGW